MTPETLLSLADRVCAGDGPDMVPLDIVQHRQPGRLRRAICELTGGHAFDEYYAAKSGVPWAFRLQCARCRVTTRWRSLRALAAGG